MTSTGPPIPHPVAGQNAIGLFDVGTSPVGDIPAFDFWKTVISQYGNSTSLTSIISSFFAAEDQTADMQAFFDNIWNIDTAQGFGLDVWGRIVGVGRAIPVTVDAYLGFGNGNYEGFGGGPFFNGSLTTNNVNLTDPAYRQVILAKAFANIMDGTIPSYNALLLMVFADRGNAYVIDNGDMTMTYAFEFSLTEFDLALMNAVIPHPTGVGSNIVQNLPVGVAWDSVVKGNLTTLSVENVRLSVGSNPLLSIQGARSNWFHIDGRHYVEMTMLASASPNVVRLGIGNGNAVVFSQALPRGYTGPPAISIGPLSNSAISGQQFEVSGSGVGVRLGTTLDGLGYDPVTGIVYINNAVVATIATLGLGGTLGIAIDQVHLKAWLCVNGGLWNNSATADPSANIGGIDISAFASGGAQVWLWADVEQDGLTVVQMNPGDFILSRPLPNTYSFF